MFMNTKGNNFGGKKLGLYRQCGWICLVIKLHFMGLFGEYDYLSVIQVFL